MVERLEGTTDSAAFPTFALFRLCV
jgi:hypothetical protein